MIPGMMGWCGALSLSSLSDTSSSSKLVSTSGGVSVRAAGYGDTPWMYMCQYFIPCMYACKYVQRSSVPEYLCTELECTTRIYCKCTIK